MSLLLFLTVFALVACLGTLAMTLWNLSGYREPASPASGARPSVAVCIPARDEESNIRACVESALAQRGADVEVMVYDDESSDRTPEILAELRAGDDRVRPVARRPLPEGWAGKQHACHRAGEAATADWVLFTDADVRLHPDAAALAIAHAERTGCELVSTFPRQITGTLAELSMVPMMFFLLFSYLPMARMRRTTEPQTCAGCGQFLLARRTTYRELGGHEPFKASFHDGIKMPRTFRAAGHRTDLFDGTRLARVRMYRGLSETWRGFAKNAYEGLGSVGLLVFLTVLHAVGFVLPWIVLAGVAMGLVRSPVVGLFAAAAVLVAGVQRAVLAERFAHSYWLSLIHPLTIVFMTFVQWWSFVISLKRARTWRGRVLASAG
ncbi:MAG: glycosyltransferase family 2 protein [Planctomycetota bacterium]